MKNFKHLFAILLSFAILVAPSAPVFAIEYSPGIIAGQYVTYGNFVGSGPGVESFNDYAWSKLTIVSVSGKEVTLLSTGQYKNGTATPGNSTTNVWNVEAGTEDGLPSTQGPIIAANLNQGDAIPPPNTYSVNRTENRAYLGVTRAVNILSVEFSTPDYNTTLFYVYDKLSGMLLESTTQTSAQGQPEPITSQFSYSLIATNIFGSSSNTSTPTSPSATPTETRTPETPTQTPLSSNQPLSAGIPLEYILVLALVIIIITAAVTLATLFRKKR
jgi:hypothetical protein